MGEPSGARDNLTVGIGSGVFLVLAVVLASQVAPPSRLRRFSIREAVLALCGVTVASSILGIVGGSHADVCVFGIEIECSCPSPPPKQPPPAAP
jgi:hypothetical protein